MILRRVYIAAIIGAFVLTATAQAGEGSASLCAKGGWATAQSGSGGSFASMHECVKAQEVYAPTLSIDPVAVTAGQIFTVSGSGFHRDAQDMSATLSFAVTAQSPYFFLGVSLKADGTFLTYVSFSSCGSFPDLTLTLTDPFGVHASARIQLCGVTA